VSEPPRKRQGAGPDPRDQERGCIELFAAFRDSWAAYVSAWAAYEPARTEWAKATLARRDRAKFSDGLGKASGKRIRCTLALEDGPLPVEIRLSARHWRGVQVFRDCLVDLEATEAFQQRLKLSFKFQSKGTAPRGELRHNIGQSAFDAMLLRLRPFLIFGEIANFDVLCAALWQAFVRYPSIRRHLAGCLNLARTSALKYRAFEHGEAAGPSAENDDLFEMWLNSRGRYHTDQDKEERFRRLSGSGFSELVAQDAMFGRIHGIRMLGALVTPLATDSTVEDVLGG
jgi:hypothetical protein